MMTPPLKLLSYSSSHQVCMCHGLNLWVNFSKIKNNILYFQNPLVILFLYIVYCCNSSTSKIKNSTLFHYRYRPPGTVSEVCGGAEGQCLAPGYDLLGARSRPQGRGADLKGPDSKGTLGVLTELSSGSLLHASATGHSRKVRVINIMCFWSICYGICLLYVWFILPCNSLEKIGGGENWKQKLFWFNLRSNSLILLFHVIMIRMESLSFNLVYLVYFLQTKSCRRWPWSTVPTLAQFQTGFKLPNIHTPDWNEGQFIELSQRGICF